MTDISTGVLIIGTGPAGSATAALLASYGVDCLVVNRYRWLARTPRAPITNQRTMEVLCDLGSEVEAEACMHATDQDLMGENVFCESLAGEELGRMKSWGNHPLSRAEHQMSSPCTMNDLPQTFMEPILFKTACSRGAQSRMSMEAGAKQRGALRRAIEFKKYEFDCHGVEMNQRYVSAAVLTDGQPEPAFDRDPELHYHPTIWPGARLPHVWVFDGKGKKHSSLDLSGRGQFTLFTGIGGAPWVE